jgi:hypothetical protein
MYKEYRFYDPEKAIKKSKQLKNDFGYTFPIYKIQQGEKEFLSLVYPAGLQPNPKRRK